MKDNTNNAYKEAGVDIDAGADVVERIKPHVQKTFRDGVMTGLGGFGAFFDLAKTGYKDPVLVSATDGVGTKLKVAIETGRYDTVGIDLVAMCVNDLIVQGAEPLFFLDYFACGKLEPDMAEAVIAGIAAGCQESGCALIGGETAEMPGMYAAEDFDLAGFCVGAVERDEIVTGEHIKEGDIVIGLASSGLHSNGYSLVRRVVETTQGFSYGASAPFDNARTLGEVFLTPTKLYVRSVLKGLKEKDGHGAALMKGLANITGGGLIENIPRVLPEGLGVQLDASKWPVPPEFIWLADAGRLSAHDMACTFNCGIGMVAICAEDNVDRVEESLTKSGETVYRIGVVSGSGAVEILNADESWHLKS